MTAEKTAILFDIERCSYVDGPGIRTTVFFKGCNLHCQWCHNPESQNPCPEMLFYRDKCTGCGKCRSICPSPEGCTLCGKCAFFCPADARSICGREYTLREVLAEIRKDRSLYENSGGGVTFSGGECMLQADFLAELLQLCKAQGIHTAVDTAGLVPFSTFEKVLPYTDLFLYDIKLLDPEKHRQYTGVSNRLILENLKKLFSAGAKLWIRIPVIGGVNDSPLEITEILEFLSQCGKPEKLELLPYHAMGEHKYGALGKAAKTFPVPTQQTMAELTRLLLLI